MQHVETGEKHQDKGHGKSEQTKAHHLPAVVLQSVHVNLQSGKKHDVIKPHLAEKLKTAVSLQNVQSVFANQHTGKHHSDNMRNAQLAHDDGGKQDNTQHHEEDQRRVCYG